MKHVDYLKSLNTTIDVAQLLEDVGITRSELVDYTLPGLEEADFFDANFKFQNKWVVDKKKRFENTIRVPSNRNFIQVITSILQTLPERLDWLEKELNALQTKTIVSSALTFPKITLIRILEAISFVTKYARRFLLLTYCYSAETFLKDIDSSIPFSKAEIKQIEEQFAPFLSTLKMFDMPQRKMAKEFDAIPEVEVLDSDDGTADTIGMDKLDPIRTGFVNTPLSPIYHILWVRKVIAEWQVGRYESAKNEKMALELRNLQLKMAKEGTADATTERTLEQLDSRIQKLNYKIAKMESDYA